MHTKSVSRLLVVILLLAAIPAVAIAAGQERVSEHPTPVPLTAPDGVTREPFVAVEESLNQPDDDKPKKAIETQCGWYWYGAMDYSGDVDYYKFYAQRGETFAARVQASEYGTGLDPTLTLYDTNGKDMLYYRDDYDGLDPIIHYTFSDEGYFYLAVRGYADYSLGDYWINVEKPIYLSTSSAGTVDGMKFAPGDVLQYNGCGDYWEMFLNAKSLGLKGNLNGLALTQDREALVSFNKTQKFYGQNVTKQDIALCYLYDIGWDSDWDCSLFFDGSDVGLTKGSEAVNSIAISPYGNLLMSFTGTTQVPNIYEKVADEDILEFYPYQYGTNTDGYWNWFFDGSDENLGKVRTDGLWLNGYYWDIYQTFNNAVTVPTGVELEKGDVGACWSWGWGQDSYCGNWWELFDATDAGFKRTVGVDAIDLGGTQYLYMPYDPYPYPSPNSADK